MKSLITIVVLIITSLNMYNAQDNRDSLQFGPKVGVNYSNVYDSQGDNFSADGKPGLVFGGFVAIPIGTYLGVHSEVLFSQKGFRGSGSILGSSYEFTRTTSYIDVPLYFALKPTNNFTFVVGPQFSYLLNRKDVFTSSGSSFAQEQEFENENIRKNTLGASMGFDIKINRAIIGTRANWDLQENHGDGTASTPRYKNQWLQLSLGFRF